MCGILAVFGCVSCSEGELRRRAIAASRKVRHRGPDWTGTVVLDGGHAICHERLGIVDPESGAQPLVSGNDDGRLVLAVNGEVYNYRELYEALPVAYTPTTGSDCEVIIPLFQQFVLPSLGECLIDGLREILNRLRGMFSFVVFDKVSGSYYAVRDHMGITPLYIGYASDGSVWFASEMKSLTDHCVRYEVFPPGHVYIGGQAGTAGRFERWYRPSWTVEGGGCKEGDVATGADLLPTPGHGIAGGGDDDLAAETAVLTRVREGFERAVVRRMMCDVPWGVLLSGGLDSSLVASIAARHARRRTESDVHGTEAWYPRLHSFTIGLENSPDLAAAKEVAEFLGTVHHSYTFTLQEGLDALREVIYHLETFDTTTVRASTPMFLMSRKIKAMGVKMVLSGEGADEAFGGYLYFHKCPSSREFADETRDKLARLYQFDCLRANKSTSAWGLEARVPFLDYDFLDLAMGEVDPLRKMVHRQAAATNAGADSGSEDGAAGKNVRDGGRRKMEKYLIRRAFDVSGGDEEPYLPDHILWRQKEQFSDGVGYGWIDALRDHAEKEISDQQLASAANLFPVNPPTTKEAYLYRSIFADHFPNPSAAATVPGGKSIACSTERALNWDASFEKSADCSGRSVAGVHNDAYGDQVSSSSSSSSSAVGLKRKRDEAP